VYVCEQIWKMEGDRKIYDLEERTAKFARRVRDFCLRLLKNSINLEYISQLITSSSSPGANYIEANENLGEKDFGMRMKICRKESKESAYWLRLVIIGDSNELEMERNELRQEAIELVRIFSTILINRSQKNNGSD
jgi:four helix bundle protein